MKHDYGAFAGIPLHISEHLFAVEFLGVVARYEVVHDDVEVVLDDSRLLPAQ